MLNNPSVLRTAPLIGSKTLKLRISPLIGGVAKPRGLIMIHQWILRRKLLRMTEVHKIPSKVDKLRYAQNDKK
jgi:hypothetical protein